MLTFLNTSIVPITLVFIGTFFLVFSIFISIKVQKKVPPNLFRRWHVLSLLICFFLCGYFGYILLRILEFDFSLEILTSVVFLGGAIFVYGIVDLSNITIHKLHEGNETLEKLVSERTAELIETNRNLTKSKKKYLDQSHFLENILDALSHPFYVINVRDHSIALYNKASGFSEKAGTTCHQLSHDSSIPCDGNDHPCTMKEIMKTGKPIVLEHIHKGQNGNLMNVEIHGYPLFDSHGKIVQIVEYIHDVTDRKRSEYELRLAKQEAEKASRSKSVFLANVSHEIRTPMNAILGMTELALNTELNQKQLHYLSTVKESSELLLNLINDILDLSKIEAGKLQLEIRPLYITDVMTTVIQSMKHVAEEKGITINSTCDEKLFHMAIRGDDLRLRQVLYNLIGNGLKFTHAGAVEATCSIVEKSSKDVKLLFTVKDTGIGIGSHLFEQIFESFSQADNSTTRHHGGTGLGLTICRLLVELMGGKIWVESTLNEGSIFSFTVNFQIEENNTVGRVAVERKDKKAIRPLKILIVDDIATNRELAKIILEQNNHCVLEAENGMQALEMMIENDFDVIFLDVQMPIMDGIKTAEYIRLCEQGDVWEWSEDSTFQLMKKLTLRIRDRHTPLIAMTAQAMTGDRIKCIAAGMDNYISKPFKTEGILQMLSHELVETKR